MQCNNCIWIFLHSKNFKLAPSFFSSLHKSRRKIKVQLNNVISTCRMQSRDIVQPKPIKQQVEKCTCNDALTRGPRPAPTTINTWPHEKYNDVKLCFPSTLHFIKYQMRCIMYITNKIREIAKTPMTGSLTVVIIDAFSSGTLSCKALQTALWYCK